MNPRDVSNALDIIMHMIRVLSEGNTPHPDDMKELKQLIRNIEASK